MTIDILPDVQAMVTKYLNEHPSLIALNCRAASKLPDTDNFTRPMIKVSQLDATDSPIVSVEYIVNWFMQFDAYAGSGANNSAAQANLISRTLRSVLKSLQGEVTDGVTVTRVAFTGHVHLPDESFSPWRQRYVVDAEIAAHA